MWPEGPDKRQAPLVAMVVIGPSIQMGQFPVARAVRIWMATSGCTGHINFPNFQSHFPNQRQVRSPQDENFSPARDRDKILLFTAEATVLRQIQHDHMPPRLRVAPSHSIFSKGSLYYPWSSGQCLRSFSTSPHCQTTLQR
jgi:hypothetical protein